LRERTFRHGGPELFRGVTAELERQGRIVSDQDVLRLTSHETTLSPVEKKAFEPFRTIYSKAGLEMPKLDEALRDVSEACGTDPRSARKIFQLLIDGGEIVSITNEFYIPASVIDGLTEKVRGHARASGDALIDVSKFKEIAGISRKYAIPLLEYFDRTRVTRRVGDKRQIL
jgi:selenocysteine-specific elongation factor